MEIMGLKVKSNRGENDPLTFKVDDTDGDGVCEVSVKLVFEGGDEPEVPEYEFLINLTVEGGEAAVKAQYTGAEGRQTVDLVEGPNYISGITAGLMNRRGVTVFASDAEGYVMARTFYYVRGAKERVVGQK